MPSSNARFLVIKRVISLSPNVTLWHGKDLRYQCFIEMQYIIASFSHNHSNTKMLERLIRSYIIEVDQYFYQQQNALFRFGMKRKRCCHLNLLCSKLRSKSLALNHTKTLHTRDFRITIIFRGMRIYLCYFLLRCRK